MAGMYRVRATISGTQGLPGLYTAYFRAEPGGGNSGSAAAVAARVRGAWDVFKTSLLTNITVQVQPIVDVLEDEGGDLIGSFGVTPPAAVVGTVGTASGPSEVAAGLVLETGVIVSGRRLRGRQFLSPIANSQMIGTTPTGGIVTNTNAFGVALIGATPPLATAPAVVWSRPTATRVGSSFPVVSATCAAKWFVLRSRRD